VFLTEFTPSYSLTHNGDDAPQNPVLQVNSDTNSISTIWRQYEFHSGVNLLNLFFFLFNGTDFRSNEGVYSFKR